MKHKTSVHSEQDKNKMKNNAIVLTGILIVLLLLTIFINGCSDTQYTSGNSIENPNVDQENTNIKTVEQHPTTQLQILDHKMEHGQYEALYVTGTAKNIGNSQLSYAEIRVRFYDSDNNLIDTSLDNINDLSPGQVWKFKVMYFSIDTSEVDHYDIGVGSVW